MNLRPRLFHTTPCLWACFLFLCALANSMKSQSEGLEGHNKAVVRIRHARSTQSELVASIEALGDTHDLVLRKIEASPIEVHHLVPGPNGTLIVVNETDQVKNRVFFSDGSKGAVLYLNNENTLEGMMTERLSLRVENGEHFVSSIHLDSGKFCNEMPLDVDDEQNLRKREEEVNFEARANPSYVVEVTVLADSALVSQFNSLNDLITYLKCYWFVVQQRFLTVNGVSIGIRLTDIIYSDSAAVDNHFMDSSGYYSNIKTTLGKLSAHMGSSYGNYNPFDIAHLMSGRDFYSVNNDGSFYYGESGSAYTGGVCDCSNGVARNTGASEDDGFYGGTVRTSHEVAHNLGAPHDGQGTSSSCERDYGFIMSDLKVSLTHFWFSPCSSEALRNIYYTPGKKCLQTISNGNYYKYNGNLPGLSLSLDYQCQYHTRKPHALVDKRFPPSYQCVWLRCQYTEGSSTYFVEPLTHALEGTPCYGGGYCIDGSCQD